MTVERSDVLTPLALATPFVYPARAVRVIDGDTLVVVLDRGWSDTSERALRVLGVDCPELHGPEHEAGLAARAYTVDWLAWAGTDAWPLLVESVALDSFGRCLGRVWRRNDGHELSADLLAAGQAVAYQR